MRIITYNIHRAIGVDRRFRPERIAGILAHYGADVVFLQEVDEGVPRSRELDLARELADTLGYPHFAVGHNVTLRKGRYGNATLSRFPILRETNLDLTIGSSAIGSLIRRGCQHTTLALPEGGTLEAFNLHLGLSAREREKQIGLLVNSSEFRRIGPEIPLLVGGDFASAPHLHRGVRLPLRHRPQGIGGGASHLSLVLAPGRARPYLLPRPAGARERALLPSPGVARGERPPARHRGIQAGVTTLRVACRYATRRGGKAGIQKRPRMPR